MYMCEIIINLFKVSVLRYSRNGYADVMCWLIHLSRFFSLLWRGEYLVGLSVASASKRTEVFIEVYSEVKFWKWGPLI